MIKHTKASAVTTAAPCAEAAAALARDNRAEAPSPSTPCARLSVSASVAAKAPSSEIMGPAAPSTRRALSALQPLRAACNSHRAWPARGLLQTQRLACSRLRRPRLDLRGRDQGASQRSAHQLG